MFSALKKYWPPQVKEDGALENVIANERTMIHTPDIMLLEQQAHHTVFLYCDRQMRHVRALDGAELLWEGFTKNQHLFWKHDVGQLSHPIATNAIPAFKRSPFLPVRGEVVKVSTQRLVQLDVEKENRVQYRRVKVFITVHLHKMVETMERSRMEAVHGTPFMRGDRYPIPVHYTVEAWMYIGVAKYWTPLLDGGYLFKEGKIITPNKSKMDENRYYFFPPNGYT